MLCEHLALFVGARQAQVPQYDRAIGGRGRHKVRGELVWHPIDIRRRKGQIRFAHTQICALLQTPLADRDNLKNCRKGCASVSVRLGPLASEERRQKHSLSFFSYSHLHDQRQPLAIHRGCDSVH